MGSETVKIELYDKRLGLTANLYVEELGSNLFRMTENDLFNCNLTLGTEFETRINKEGKHEIIRITKRSTYVTRRFLLSSNNTESEVRLLGDDIVKQGGHWQLDMGGILTINMPSNSSLQIEKLFKTFNFMPTEIAD